MIRDKLYPLSENTIYFNDGKDAHYSSPELPQKYIRSKIIFSADILLELAKALKCSALIKDLFWDGGSIITLSADSSSKIDKCFFNLSLNQSENYQNSYDINFFINLFSIIDLSLKNKSSAIKTIDNKISEVITFINRNSCQKLTLDYICDSVKISKYYLCREFKNTVGMTVFEYIEFSRISLSKDLLLKTDKTISEISEESGFESTAYFSKVFKKIEKISPSTYRKQGTPNL